MSTSSFQFHTPEQIECAKEVVHLDHVAICRRAMAIRPRNLLQDGCECWCCAWAPDGSYLAWSAGHRMVHLIPWDSNQQKRHNPNDFEGVEGRQYHVIDSGELVHSVAFGQSTNNIYKQRWKRLRCDRTILVLATGHPMGRIKLWNCETGVLLVEMMDHKDVVHDLHFSQDDTLHLASASRDGSVKLWEFDEQGGCNMYLTIKISAKHAFACRWSPDRRYLAAAGSFRRALLFRIDGRQIEAQHRLEGHYHDVVRCDFSPDGALLATASFDTQVIIWDVHTQTMVAQLGHLYPSPRPIYAGGANDHYVYSVQFSPEGYRLASVGEDSYVRIWQLSDVSDPVNIASVDGARCCSFSADGHLLAVGTNSGSLSVLSTPRAVDKLMHLCRRVVRCAVPSPAVSTLPVPDGLKKYLVYSDVSSH